MLDRVPTLSERVHLGCRALDVIDDVQGARVPARVLYATDAAPRAEAFGPYAIDVAIDGPVVGRELPLVVISHGTGGTPWGYRGIAEHLVRAGFAVAMIEHPGNTRGDDALAGTAANLANRPRHVRRVIDAAVADSHVRAHLRADRVAVIGHSLGGYTALAVAGGRPMSLPNQAPDGVARPVDVTPDPRVRAVVLLAPALPWFMVDGALDEVRAPVMVRTGECDDVSPPAFVERVLRGLPPTTSLDHEVVAGAGHFLCFWPVPPALTAAKLPPAIDPPGFDRGAYQPRLRADLTAFLSAALA